MKPSMLIDWLAGRILGVIRPHPVRVAIDGVDGVGKTTSCICTLATPGALRRS
jgi:hypothetical protein